MNDEKNFTENLIDYDVLKINKKYRESFGELIIESKKLTHECQLECYNKIKKDLKEAEKCSRNCFLPMIHIKKNITKLMESSEENLEQCKTKSLLNKFDVKYDRSKIIECLTKYEEDLFKTRDESKYIYSGYMKNFSSLINNVKNI